MKIVSFLLLVASTMFYGGLIAQEIDFTHSPSLKKAMERAEAENKMIFIDVYTTWCGPCRWMDSNVFNDPQVADFFNQKFVSIKADAEAAGRGIASRFAVRSYPTFLFLDGAGKLLAQEKGSRPAEIFLALGRSIVPRPAHLAEMDKRFVNGERGQEFIVEYFSELKSNLDAKYKPGVKKYLKEQDDVLDRFAMEILMEHSMGNMKSSGYKAVLQNRDAFNTEFGVEIIDQKLREVLRKKWTSLEADEVGPFKRKYIKPFGDRSEQYFVEDKLYHDLRQGRISDFRAFADAAKDCFEQGDCDDWFLLNAVTYRMALMTGAPQSLSMLRGWIEKSIELQRSYLNLDTYSVILYKQGSKDEAIAMVQEANALAHAEGVKFKSSITLLRK